MKMARACSKERGTILAGEEGRGLHVRAPLDQTRTCVGSAIYWLCQSCPSEEVHRLKYHIAFERLVVGDAD
jgi:hypothetical protein